MTTAFSKWTSILSFMVPHITHFYHLAHRILKIEVPLEYVRNRLEPVCCKKRQKSPNQENGLGNWGPLEALIDTKLILNEPE